jgi:plasmid stabilization system protein ParE
MTKYAFHAGALADLEEIWGFIRADNLDAADRVISEILASIEALVATPNRGQKTAAPYVAASALHSCA